HPEMRARRREGGDTEHDMPAVGQPCEAGHPRDHVRPPLEAAARLPARHRENPELPSARLRLQVDAPRNRAERELAAVWRERQHALDKAKRVERRILRRFGPYWRGKPESRRSHD